MEQRFSKLEGSDRQRLERSTRQTRDCIEQGHARAVPLHISEARLNSLLQLGVIDKLEQVGDSNACRFTAGAPSGNTYAFEARRDSENHDYRILHEGVAIEVLAASGNEKPLTADYDLLMIAPHVSDWGPQDNLPVPDIAHPSHHQVERFQPRRPPRR